MATVVGEASASAALLTRAPGVDGLRQFIGAATRAGGDQADIAAAFAATEQFELVLHELHCSQSRLALRLKAGETDQATSGGSSGDLAAREQLFLGASMCTGRQCQFTGSIYLFRPHPEDAAARERVLVHSVIGHAAAADAAPFALSSWVPKDGPSQSAAPPLALLNTMPAHGSSEHALIREFSTQPLPMTTVRDDHGQLTTVIDARVSTGESSLIDVVTANCSLHRPTVAELGGRAIRDVWKLINVPARHMVFDVYLHRRLAAGCVPTLDLLLWSPNLEAEQRWAARLPGRPRLELLGSGLRNAASTKWARHADLTAFTFAEIGWNPDEFIGFRCETSYPVWRAGYCMSFAPMIGVDEG